MADRGFCLIPYKKSPLRVNPQRGFFAAGSCRPTAVGERLSVNGFRRSVNSGRLSVNGGRRSAVGQQQTLPAFGVRAHISRFGTISHPFPLLKMLSGGTNPLTDESG